VENQSARARYCLYLEAAGQPPTATDIEANGGQAVQLAVPTARRGLLKLDTITISSSYPLGLFRAWSYLQLEMQCVVYPRPAAHTAAPAGQGTEHGPNPTHMRGTEDFIGLRSYAIGDSLRHVHWKAIARGQAMMTKQFGDTEADTLWLEWDGLVGLDAEARLSVLCRWVVDAERDGVRYGLRLPGQVFTPDIGPEHRHQCLQALALYGNSHV